MIFGTIQWDIFYFQNHKKVKLPTGKMKVHMSGCHGTEKLFFDVFYCDGHKTAHE